MALAGLHTVFGIVVWSWSLHAALYPWPLRDDVPVAPDAASVTWFLIVGVPLFLLGWVLDWSIAKTGELPPRRLFVVAGIGMVGLGCLFPVSGFWIAAALCAWLGAGPRAVVA